MEQEIKVGQVWKYNNSLFGERSQRVTAIASDGSPQWEWIDTGEPAASGHPGDAMTLIRDASPAPEPQEVPFDRSACEHDLPDEICPKCARIARAREKGSPPNICVVAPMWSRWPG